MLKELIDYGERRAKEKGDSALPDGYQNLTIHWLIPLSSDGELLGGLQRTSGKDERAKTYQAPKVVRSGQASPQLFSDSAEYTLGIGRDEINPDLLEKRRVAYRELLADCVDKTGLPQAKAVATFLESFDVNTLELPEDFKATENISFVIDGELPFELTEFKAFWAERFKQKPPKGARLVECLISGEKIVPMEREPVRVKGIPGGLGSGLNVITADKKAYESHGFSASSIASIAQEHAITYANALNDLLSNKNTHLRIGETVYIFWTDKGETPPVAPLLNNPQAALLDFIEGREEPYVSGAHPDQVRQLLSSAWLGKYLGVTNKQSFFATNLSARGARVVFRSNIRMEVAALSSSLEAYFERQNIIYKDGSPGKPIGIYALAASLCRSRKPKEIAKEMVKSDPAALLNHALKGTPLPWTWFSRLNSRNRAEKEVTYRRAALAKMLLISNARTGEDYTNMNELVRDHPETAYHLGRLLAVLDSIQYRALGNVNASVVDRFYGSLSTMPASVFGRLISGSVTHLSKIKKNNGSAHGERQLEEVLSHISDVPNTLDSREQALFALGFYHERAAKWKEIAERKSAKDNDPTESEGE